MAASRIDLSKELTRALLRAFNGQAVHKRYIARLVALGLVQRDLFDARISLTADGHAQLGMGPREQ